MCPITINKALLLQEGILKFELSWTAVIAKKSAIVLAVPVADLEYGASSWAFLKHISLIMIYRFTFV